MFVKHMQPQNSNLCTNALRSVIAGDQKLFRKVAVSQNLIICEKFNPDLLKNDLCGNETRPAPKNGAVYLKHSIYQMLNHQTSNDIV